MEDRFQKPLSKPASLKTGRNVVPLPRPHPFFTFPHTEKQKREAGGFRFPRMVVSQPVV